MEATNVCIVNTIVLLVFPIDCKSVPCLCLAVFLAVACISVSVCSNLDSANEAHKKLWSVLIFRCTPS